MNVFLKKIEDEKNVLCIDSAARVFVLVFLASSTHLAFPVVVGIQ